MLKIMPIIGTRPEAIKMAPVIKALQRHPDQIETIVCSTGQHREMLDQVLSTFEIQPTYDLELMRPNQTLSKLTARLFIALDDLISQERPDWLLVQGDTTSVMVGSLVAYYHGVKVGHVEAGLRTGDKHAPFPEEINRRIADLLADLYFAPTERNRQTLLREHVSPEAIIVTGNTVVDALLLTARRLQERSVPLPLNLPANKRLILVTAHRRENFGTPLMNICHALKQLAKRYTHHIHIVYPVHLNPNVWTPVHEMLTDIPNISLIEPVEYEQFINLLQHAHLILSDSGGLQEEAPSLNKPLLLLRDVTERPEAVETGAVKIVGPHEEAIIRETSRLLEDVSLYQQMAMAANPYGDGQASERIVQAILGAK